MEGRGWSEWARRRRAAETFAYVTYMFAPANGSISPLDLAIYESLEIQDEREEERLS